MWFNYDYLFQFNASVPSQQPGVVHGGCLTLLPSPLMLITRSLMMEQLLVSHSSTVATMPITCTGIIYPPLLVF